MRNRLPLTLMIALTVVLGAACGNDAPGPEAANATQAALAPEAGVSPEPMADAATAEARPGDPAAASALPELAEPAVAAPTAFDPGSVAETTAVLPPFPFFQAPEGLASLLKEKDRSKSFDREHMIAGDRIVAVEGKVFRDRFRLADPKQREYSEIEFHRNYADAVAALGGVEVSAVQYTPAVLGAFGGRAAVDRHYHGSCASHGCENHTYLIRQDGREYWIQASTGGIPLHGQVVLLERQAMAGKLAFLDAAAMKKQLDAEGRVALYINFDNDKAMLRPDAAAVIEEITRLLRDDAELALSIDGHTDNTGSAARNLELSRQRAAAVVAALVAAGIDASRLEAQGFGADRPLAANGDEAGRARNRRVELVKKS